MKIVYNKLVRDRIPEYLRAKGIAVSVHTLPEEQILAHLLEKLKEESAEASKANPDKLAEEIGDLLEILEAIASKAGIAWTEVCKIKMAKSTERGGFALGVILEYADSPTDDYHRE